MSAQTIPFPNGVPQEPGTKHHTKRPQTPEEIAPHNREAEEHALGSLLFNPEWLPYMADDLFGMLKPEHFFITAHSILFRALLRVFERGEADNTMPLTLEDRVVEVSALPQLLKDELRAAGEDPDVLAGQHNTFGAWWTLFAKQSAPDLDTARAFATIVKERAYRRVMLETATRLSMTAYNTTIRMGELIEGAQIHIEALRPDGVEKRALRGADSGAFYLQVIEERRDRGKVLMMPTKGLQEAFGALGTDTFAVISALSGMGKTLFLEAWAEFLASMQHYKVVFAHGELTQATMLDRRNARHSQIAYSKLIEPRRMTAVEMRRLRDTQERIADWSQRIDLFNTRGLMYNAFIQQVEKFIDEGADAIIGDYFQKWIGIKDVDRTNAFIDSLRRLAEDHHVPIIIGSQLTVGLMGEKPYGSKYLNDASTLHLKIVRERLDSDYAYSSNGETTTIKAGRYSPEARIETQKSSNTGAHTVAMFIDGPRFLLRDMTTFTQAVDLGLDDQGKIPF
jgi:replicative DNA helicase